MQYEESVIITLEFLLKYDASIQFQLNMYSHTISYVDCDLILLRSFNFHNVSIHEM